MGKPRPKRVVTPELLDHLRRRYEGSAEFVRDIALSAGLGRSALHRLAREGQWTRYTPPPLDLSPAAKLLAEVARLDDLPPLPRAWAGAMARRDDALVPTDRSPPLAEGGEKDAVAAGASRDEVSSPPTPDPSPPLAGLAGGGEKDAVAGEGDAGRAGEGEMTAGAVAARASRDETPVPPTPDPSPPLAGLAGGGEIEAAGDNNAGRAGAAGTDAGRAGTAETTEPVDLSNLSLPARRARVSELARALDARLAEVRLALATPQGTEQRKQFASELNQLTASAGRIEHHLQELNREQSFVPVVRDDDVRPMDLDERRLRLARRIREFVRARRDGEAAAGPAADGA